MDRQVQRKTGVGAGRPQDNIGGGEFMIQESLATVQTYRVYIKATPQAVWDAITQPEWTERYGYGGRGVYDLKPGGALSGVYQPGNARRRGPWRLSRSRGRHRRRGDRIGSLQKTGSEMAYEHGRGNRFRRGNAAHLRTRRGGRGHETHARPRTGGGLRGRPDILAGKWEAQGAGGGWSWVLCDMKSLLETGKGFLH